MKAAPEVGLFKVLGHPERYALLRRLMAEQATLSQLGAAFRKSPAHIRHHLKVLEAAGLVEFVEARPVQGGPEKYYRATQRALLVQQAVLPEHPRQHVGLTMGTQDAGLWQLADHLGQKRQALRLIPVPLSSLDGLIALRQGLCQMSACHLLDPHSDHYNRAFVRHLFPGQPMALVQVCRRQGGLLVRAGNPLKLRGLSDLARPAVRFVNREPGSGVRQWLDLGLKRLGLTPASLAGYHTILPSHQAVARAIRAGQADAGIGIAASARQFGLAFVPLFEEPYELAMPVAVLNDPRFAPLFDSLNSGEFRAGLRGLAGYVVTQTAGAVEVVG